MAIVCDVGIVGVLKQVLGLCHSMGHKVFWTIKAIEPA